MPITNAQTIIVSYQHMYGNADKLTAAGCMVSWIAGTSALFVSYLPEQEKAVFEVLGGDRMSYPLSFSVSMHKVRAPTEEESASDTIVDLRVDL